MTTACFNNYTALSKYINELPLPKPGHVRVFRGQPKDYGNLQPTGVRNPLRNEHIWRRYCRMLATDILIQQGMDLEAALSKSDLWAYWYYAIVQHYGPGTHLLDVTHSLDVALWFAVHKAETGERIDLRYLSSGPTSYGPALHRADEWTTYHKTESPGVVYIFDVPEWVPPELPRHGVLVDLAHGPEVFTRSARIQAQKACLLAADPQVSDGDLMKLLHAPIKVEVAWPMTGCEAVNLETDALFPSPNKDEWYARLLFLPTVHQVWDKTPHWRMAHPVQLSLYIDHLQASMYAVQFKPLQPPLLYPWLVEPALLTNAPVAARERAEPFLRTTPILLEAPILALQPEHDDESWDHAQLVSNVPTLTGFIEWVSGQISEEPAILDDVFFELSPLEAIGWTDLLRSGAEMRVARGIHLVREDEFAWRLQVFMQTAPKEQILTIFKEPAAIRYDQPSRRFQIEKMDGWKDISTDPIAAKSLFVALTLLSALSQDRRTSFVDHVKTAHVVLKQAPDIGLEIHYYVMRHPKTNEPYTGEKA